jgi:hypothetical protein
MHKRVFSGTVILTVRGDETVDYEILDQNSQRVTVKLRKDAYDAALDIGQCIFELAQVPEVGR